MHELAKRRSHLRAAVVPRRRGAARSRAWTAPPCGGSIRTWSTWTHPATAPTGRAATGRPTPPPSAGRSSGLVMREHRRLGPGARGHDHGDGDPGECPAAGGRRQTTEYAQVWSEASSALTGGIRARPRGSRRAGPDGHQPGDAVDHHADLDVAHALARTTWSSMSGRSRRRPRPTTACSATAPGTGSTRPRTGGSTWPALGLEREWKQHWPRPSLRRRRPGLGRTPGSPTRRAAGCTTATWREVLAAVFAARPGPRSTGRTTSSAGTSAAW